MQFSVIAVNVLYAVIGVVLMFVSYRTIDRLTPQVDFPAELQRGNVAVAIFIAAIFVSIALIIGKALGCRARLARSPSAWRAASHSSPR